jgi:hypothetical protein
VDVVVRSESCRQKLATGLLSPRRANDSTAKSDEFRGSQLAKYVAEIVVISDLVQAEKFLSNQS